MSGSTATLRRARREDLPAINRLMHGSGAYQGDYAAILDGYAVTEAQLDQDQLVVAEASGEILGFFSLILDPPELDLLFVADRAQGTGLGERLFQDMARIARNAGLGEVKIISHPPSVGFYERMGAVRIGESPPTGRISWSRPILRLPLG